MNEPWESNPFRRCRARLIREDAVGPYWGRCDLRRGHDEPHALERGMDVIRWRVMYVVREHEESIDGGPPATVERAAPMRTKDQP